MAKMQRLVTWTAGDWHALPGHYGSCVVARLNAHGLGLRPSDENQERDGGWLVEEVYWTVVIPWEPDAARRTVWHPTEATGPFAKLSRGAFDTVGDAQMWCNANLPGATYTIEER